MGHIPLRALHLVFIASGKTKKGAKKNFLAALELHLSVLREKATEAITV